jgi:hypothetical protein
MQPSRPPDGILTDGVVSLRIRADQDAGTFAGYADRAEAWAPSISAGLLADRCYGAEWFGACRAVQPLR